MIYGGSRTHTEIDVTKLQRTIVRQTGGRRYRKVGHGHLHVLFPAINEHMLIYIITPTWFVQSLLVRRSTHASNLNFTECVWVCVEGLIQDYPSVLVSTLLNGEKAKCGIKSSWIAVVYLDP